MVNGCRICATRISTHVEMLGILIRVSTNPVAVYRCPCVASIWVNPSTDITLLEITLIGALWSLVGSLFPEKELATGPITDVALRQRGNASVMVNRWLVGASALSADMNVRFVILVAY